MAGAARGLLPARSSGACAVGCCLRGLQRVFVAWGEGVLLSRGGGSLEQGPAGAPGCSSALIGARSEGDASQTLT